MGYQAKEGDLLIGIYEMEERQFVYGGTERAGIFDVPVYYFAGGESIGEKLGPRRAKNVEPKSLVRHIGLESWNEVLAMPSLLQKQAKLEEILNASKLQRKKLFGFI